MSKRITILDVARAAGCSHTTVSLSLSGSPLISEETRQRVREKVEELKYTPNRIARSLRLSKTQTIGIVAGSGPDQSRSILLECLGAIFLQQNYRPVPSSSLITGQDEWEGFGEFLEDRVDGIVALVSDYVEKYEESARQVNCPVVFTLGVHRPDDRADFVTVDREEGAYRAICHLLDLGHRKIGFPYRPNDILFNPPKLRGYQKALRERGIEDAERYIYPYEMNPDWFRAGRDFAESFFRLPEKPTALLMSDVSFATGFMNRIRGAGMRVPEDLAVVTYGCSREADWMEIPMTMIEFPLKAIAERAAAILISRIKGEVPAESQVVLPHNLVVRKSCGARCGTAFPGESAR